MGALPAETLISLVNQTCASQYGLCLVFLQILLYFQDLALGVFAPGVAGSGLLWLSLFVSSLVVLAVIHSCFHKNLAFSALGPSRQCSGFQIRIQPYWRCNGVVNKLLLSQQQGGDGSSKPKLRWGLRG